MSDMWSEDLLPVVKAPTITGRAYGIKKLNSEEAIIRVTGHELKRCENRIVEDGPSSDLNLPHLLTIGESRGGGVGRRQRNYNSQEL